MKDDVEFFMLAASSRIAQLQQDIDDLHVSVFALLFLGTWLAFSRCWTRTPPPEAQPLKV